MTSKNNINNKDHFLLIGSKGFPYHTKYALDSNIKVSLLIERKKYKQEYEKLFTSIFLVDNLFDFNQITSAIKEEKITSVFTRFEDYIAVVGALNEHLGLKGISYETSRNFGNKYKMKTKMLEAGVPYAKGVCADSKESIDQFLKNHSFPLILKKTSGVHSSFVYKVKSQLDLEEKLNLFISEGKSYKISKTILGLNKSNEKECDLLLEEMLEGIEVTVDTFVSNGVFTHTPICEYVLPKELGIDDSYLPIRSIPTNLSNKIKQKITSITEATLKALGANNCVCHTELFCNIEKNECWVVETTPRGGGNRSLMINHVTNTNYDKAIFMASSGKQIEKFSTNGKTFSVIEYFSQNEGIIKKIDLNFIKNIPGAKVLKSMFEIGNKVKPAYAGGKNIITISIEGNNIEKTREISINIFKKLKEAIIVE